MKLLLVAISILLLLPNFFHIQLGKKPQYDHKELFNPGLAYINSIPKLIEVSDSIAKKNNIPQGTLCYAVNVSKLIKERFYHGFSRYPLSQNWIAAYGEYFCGYGLASIVKPDDILKYNYGGCSQQSIVLMEVMKRKKIDYRSVGFPHHFATELKFNGNWYFFDPNMEPNLTDSDRLESKWNCCADSLKKYYDTTRFHDLDWAFGKSFEIAFGKTNAVAAPHATIFHTATMYLSKTLWLFPLVIVFYPRKKRISNQSKFFAPNY
ncbi:MAG: hypothetical protein M3004_05015 [Bacteroidota bacterium]|nr:hypothetical protein [Bacteroidota bacterium]